MLIRTRKYQLPTNTYIKLGMANILKEQWWVFLIYLAINAGALIWPSWWWFIGSTIALVLYLLFWLIQFAGLTQHEQGKMLFEKLSYEITSQQILVKINTKQGMPIKWDLITKANKTKDAFVLFVNKAQIIHWPYKLFKTEGEVKFIEAILKRKNLIK
ncbi:YcxB family protein [Marinigracilibium pacificum]|uniref:YcxB family protein n=1 Tax=Marinigracilibium pacificum TaxID=2729599 RepID=A0A848J0K7_9BACT|nr:YcxB family protein [Marinigracilibium pacificum]NMM46782.1 YcxB family protein [Marinigracilibium pacificum]